MLTITLAIGLTPAVELQFPSFNMAPLNVGIILLGEVFIGFFLATIVRFIISAIDLAGTLIGFQIGLANVFTASAVSSQQSALTAAFLGLFAVTFMFVTDLHFLFLETVLESYKFWLPGNLPGVIPLTEDIFSWVLKTISTCFLLGLQLSAPIIIISLLILLAGGFVGRLVPQIQVFFVFQPLQIAVGLGILFMTLEVSMRILHNSIEGTLMSLWSGT